MTPADAPPLALTMGDPAGIGAEIAVGAYATGQVDRAFFMIADPDALSGPARQAGVRIETISHPAEAATIYAGALPVLPEPLSVLAQPGHPEAANAVPTIRAIERALAFTMSGEAAAVVTNPINKKALYDGAGFAFPGHTEFLAHLGGVARPVMMIAGPSLRVVPVTIHVPLAAVPSALSTDLIVETARITASGLQENFGIGTPRLAISGLNPHAGEGGAIGREEIEIIAPAIAQLRAEGIDATGPHPADTMFHAAARARYDAALTMYHDQGLIPVKALDFERGVNVTLGLPFVRTSPDHGTAYDIAGRGLADPTSLIEALNMAARMSDTRARPR